MSDDTDTTQWSLPGGTDLPRDDLKMQMEVYNETILLRGFDGDATWVRTVSADEIANVFTQHLGFSSGLLPQDAISGGTRARQARWWRSGGRRRCGPWPCNGRRSSLPPGSGFPCRAWSSSAHRAASPGSTPQRAVRPTPSSRYSGPRPSTSSETGGSVPVATGSPRRWG